MILLPYVQLPILDCVPANIDYKQTLIDKDESTLDVCHLLKTDLNYFFQIGFFISDSIYTCKQLIESAQTEVVNSMSKFEWWILDDLREHLGYYCERLNLVPEWGVDEYYEFVARGNTPRRLDGPHKGGMLKKGEARMVILKPDGSIVHGPKVSYTIKLNKMKIE